MSIKLETSGKSSIEPLEKRMEPPVNSLAQQWAKRYLQNIRVNNSSVEERSNLSNLAEVVSSTGRERTAKKIMESLRSVSAKAWSKTESLLSTQIIQHNIESHLINPWEIAGDSFKIYQKILDVYTQQTTQRPLSLVMNYLDGQAPDIYTEQVAPNKLATVISPDIGAIRNKYTSIEPRVIGFVSMQFHYTSQMLIEPLTILERSLVAAYFKVIDDHLYMPLQRAYEAAANHDYNSPVLSAVQQLLPISTKIAKKISQRVIEMYPNYSSMSGVLSNPIVQISSIRDVEMFQVYLWVCALEESIASIQQELFPLCVMLYPTLKVRWELVRQMLHLLGEEINNCLTPEQSKTLMPYFQVLLDMFSPEVLG
ncbi:hypothetical protein [Anabaena azotica]|nr:hypothetical protein [Anabaena azotica]